MVSPRVPTESKTNAVDGRVLGIATSIAACAGDLVGLDKLTVDYDADAVRQLDVDIFDTSLTIGEVELDSLMLVELLGIIEAELDLALFDRDDIADLCTLRDLAEWILNDAEDARIRAFISEWQSEDVRKSRH
jgi:acyl carrier protein